MSARLPRLLTLCVVGACLATPALATKHHARHHSAPHAKPAASLTWRGDDTTAHGVVNDVAAAWQRAGHGKIVLQTFNTASGLDAVRSGSADLAGSARGASGDPNESGLTFTPVAWDGLVMITNPANPVSNLTLAQLHDIYYGKITNWRQVGGRNEPIDVTAVASPGDGVEFSLRSLLFGRGNQPVAAPRLYVNTNKLQEGISLDTRGLGATALSNVAGNRKLKIIRINGVAPTASTVANGSYPLFTPLYLVTNANNAKAVQAQAFLDYLNTDKAKALLRKHDLVPYQDGEVLAAMDHSRRAQILAEVGARPVPAGRGTPISAPGATYASGVARAPTSERTLAARQALDERRARDARAKAKATGKSYKVSRGDTLSSIARQHSVGVAELRRWNHLSSDAVKPGQMLVISPR